MASLFQRRKAGLPFILATVFLDVLGFGIVIPVLPALVSTMTADKPAQAYWYGALLASYGVAQFFSASVAGRDQRPVRPAFGPPHFDFWSQPQFFHYRDLPVALAFAGVSPDRRRIGR